MTDSEINLPLELWRGGVTPWDCDEMGHWNVRQYVGRAHDAILALQAELGLGEPIPETQSGLFLREAHIRFLAEARASAPLVMVGGILECRAQDMEVYFELRHVRDGRVAATYRLNIEHQSLRTRMPFNWPRRAREKADQLICTVPDYARPRGVSLKPVCFQASGAQADAYDLPVIRRAVIHPADCDATGVMRPGVFIGAVSDGFGSLAMHWHQDPTRDPLADGEGGVALEYRLHYYDLPTLGQRYVVRSGLQEVARKTRTTAHWMLCPSTGQPYASLLSVSAAFDLKTRKILTPKPEITERLKTWVIPGIGL